MNKSRDNNLILSRNQNEEISIQEDLQIDKAPENGFALKRCDSEVFDNTELIQKGIEGLQLDCTKRSFSQVKCIVDLIEQMDFFLIDRERYGQKLIDKMIYNLKYCFLEKGQTVLNPRQKNVYMYILIQGSLIQKEVNSNNVETLENGSQFGQQVRFNPSASDLSYIETERDCEFIIFNKQSYFNLVGQYEKKDIFEKIQFLVKYPFCVNWNFDSLKYMQMDMSVAKFQKGQVVFTEDSVRDKIFMVKAGEFKLLKPIIFQNKSQENLTPLSLKIRQSIEICKLEIGDIFGEEINLINEKPKRIYRAICTSSRSEVYVFDYSQFKEYLTNNQSDTLYAKCVEQIYKQRLSLTDSKIAEKQQFMQNTRYQMVQSRSCDVKGKQAICQVLDEEGYAASDKLEENFYNNNHTNNNQNTESAANFVLGLDQVNQKLNGDNNSAGNNQQIEPHSSLQKIKSQQQFCAHLILASQNKSINFTNNQINQLLPPPSSSGISQSQSQSQLKQMINQSSLQKLSSRLRKTSDMSNASQSTFDQNSNYSRSPLKKPIAATYPRVEEEITQTSEGTKDTQISDTNQSKTNLLKPKLLKIKQMKQQSSSINQNINFFKEQQNQTINCLTIFEQLDQINKAKALPVQSLQENNLNDNIKNIENSKQFIEIPQQQTSPTTLKLQNTNNPLNFKSQIQFFNILNNFPQIQQNNTANQTNQTQKNKIIYSSHTDNSFKKDNDSKQQSLHELDQDDDMHRESLKSKLHTRKRAITLSPTKKQLKDKIYSSNQNLNSFLHQQNTQMNQGLSEEEKVMKQSIKNESENTSTLFKAKNILTHNNINQSDLSTKNTSRQSTSSHCKGQVSNDNQQNVSNKPNIFYFNSHYLNETHKTTRMQITKNTTINNLQKMITQSQNIQKSIDQTQNKSNQELTMDVTKTANSFNKSFTQIDGKRIIQVDKYRIKIRDNARSSSAFEKVNSLNNKSNILSSAKLEGSTSPSRNNNSSSNSNLTIRLKRAGQHQLSASIGGNKESMNKTGYIHFPQNDIRKIKLPSKKITEILQIKPYEI